MMETVFYEDAAHLNHYFTAGMNSMNQLKRKMTLDLDFGSAGVGGNNNNTTTGGNSKQTSVIKKARVASLNTPLCGPVLNSPDLSKLNMSSPEFEKFVIQQTSTLPTPTPNQSQIFFPKNVTEEQEQYVRGFTDALTKLRESQGNGTENNNINNNNNNNVNTIVSVSVSNANNDAISTSIATSIQQQLVQTGPTVSSNSTIQLVNPSQPQQQIQLELIQQQVSLNQHAHQPPPPPYTYTNSSDDDDSDDMSENSCSNSTTSSSTYTTNGHVSVPGSQQVTFSGHHRLPDYQLAMGATGTSGSIPASAAAIGSFGSSIHIKEETGSNPSSPALSPIDMASQEKIKLERKRQRNRVAASKCRKRKLERISKLEDKVKQLKGENSDLTNVLTKLKETVCSLKQQVLTHVNSGCTLMLASNQVVTTSSSF